MGRSQNRREQQIGAEGREPPAIEANVAVASDDRNAGRIARNERRKKRRLARAAKTALR
jgi:hypothetical protein